MFLENEYTLEYFQIIEYAQSQHRKKNLGIYFENHHIIPSSLGGDNSKSNKVLLTPEEHFKCHVLLTKMTDGDKKVKMNYALYCLKRKCGNEFINVNFTCEEYAIARKKVCEDLSKRFKGKKRPKQVIEKLKKPKSKQHKENIGKALKGRIPWNKGVIGVKEGTSKKLSETAKKTWTGRKHSQETIQKMREKRKGKIPWNKGKKKSS